MELGALLGDRFEIEQQIAKGGMGEVFRARDRVSNEVVAVKVLSDGRDRRGERFAREVQLLSELSHPGIVRYVSHGETPSGALFLAMETGDREPLARFWWHIAIGMRASYAHDDPWQALEHSDAIQAIFDATGYELVLLNLKLYRAKNLWFLGALAPAEQLLEAIVPADEALGVASSLRRFVLAWLYADRGAFDEARVLATELSEDGHANQVSLDEGRGRWVLAEVLRRMGDLEGAEREIQAALGMMVALERPGALGTLAMLRLAQGRPQEALAVAEDAVSRCTAMGGCGIFRGAFVRLAHAEALHATGAHDARTLALARAWLDELAPNA